MELKTTSINSLSCVMDSLGLSVGALGLSNAIAIVFLCWREGWKETRGKSCSLARIFAFIFIRHAAGNTLNSFCFILLFLHAQHAAIARRQGNIYRAAREPRGESAGSELFS